MISRLPCKVRGSRGRSPLKYWPSIARAPALATVPQASDIDDQPRAASVSTVADIAAVAAMLTQNSARKSSRRWRTAAGTMPNGTSRYEAAMTSRKQVEMATPRPSSQCGNAAL